MTAEDREVDLVVQFREDDRSTLDQLKKMPIMASDARLPIGAMAAFELEEGPRRIEREDKRPKLSITANTNTASGYNIPAVPAGGSASNNTGAGNGANDTFP